MLKKNSIGLVLILSFAILILTISWIGTQVSYNIRSEFTSLAYLV